MSDITSAEIEQLIIESFNSQLEEYFLEVGYKEYKEKIESLLTSSEVKRIIENK